MNITPDFAAHRARLLDRLDADEAVLLFSSPHHVRNGDAEYRYRPDSDVFWLTGWEDPDVVVFLRPGVEPLTMFCQPKDPERETWTGIRPGPEGAKDAFGADHAFKIGELEAQLPRLLQGVRRLHYGFARDPEHDAVVASAIAKGRRAARYNGLDIPEIFVSPSLVLHEVRMCKGDDEVAVLRRSAEITAAGHLAAMKLAAPGRLEFEVEAALLAAFLHEGSTGAGYTPIVAGGVHANILHYITNRDVLRDGDLLLLDAGAEHCCYTTDVTRTWPVGGKFSDAQRDVYSWVLKAQEAAIEASVVGTTFKQVHDIATRILTEGMVALGLLTGDVDELIEAGSHKRFYMHGTSHWLGLDVHDVGAYGRNGESRKLEAGFVLTIEPGLYIPNEDDIPAHLRGIGVRIEDDVLVTADGYDVLTSAIPKQVDELEAICS
jgi:Xaa-Pro aminopeptidase